MTLSITRTAVPILVALSLFGLLFAGVAFAQIEEANDCLLRATLTPAETLALSGDSSFQEVPGGPLPLRDATTGISDPDAGTHAIFCTYGLVKWASGIIFIIVFTVAILFLAWAAFLFVTAGQNPDRAKQARTYIIYAVVGLIVAALARVIPAIARGIIGV